MISNYCCSRAREIGILLLLILIFIVCSCRASHTNMVTTRRFLVVTGRRRTSSDRPPHSTGWPIRSQPSVPTVCQKQPEAVGLEQCGLKYGSVSFSGRVRSYCCFCYYYYNTVQLVQRRTSKRLERQTPGRPGFLICLKVKTISGRCVYACSETWNTQCAYQA